MLSESQSGSLSLESETSMSYRFGCLVLDLLVGIEKGFWSGDGSLVVEVRVYHVDEVHQQLKSKDL